MTILHSERSRRIKSHIRFGFFMLTVATSTSSCSHTNMAKSVRTEISSQETSLPRPAQTSRRLALVIGNEKYSSAPLSTSKNDAVAMGHALEAVGFDVALRTDIGRRQIRQSVKEFGALLAAGGTGLFYYSGHGMQVDGRNYIIPIDADITSESDVEDEGVAINSVLVHMEAARSNPNIVILDACRDNPFEKRFKSGQKGLAPIGAPPGTLIAYATAPGEVADSGPRGGHSPFTEALLQEIAVPASSAWETFNRVARRVEVLTSGSQRPTFEYSSYLDFAFNPSADGDVISRVTPDPDDQPAPTGPVHRLPLPLPAPSPF